MTFGYVATLFCIAFVGSFLSGLLGIGGAIINYPLLLYVPVMMGFLGFTPHQVSGVVAVQVFFATMAGVVAIRKQKLINFRLVAYMGIPIVIGSFVGAFGGKLLSGNAVNMVYGILAVIAVIMMLIPRKGIDDILLDELNFNRPIAVVSSLVVGIASGIVGAGGAFMLVPIMLTVLKIPTRITIATSLAITFISSIGATAGKVMAGHIPLWPSVIVVIGSLLAAPLGTTVSKRINTKVLRIILLVMIVGTTIKIWSSIL
ncbi:sulfite exporter TauE/SafE family protein [Alicyclobacillus dauci]|uniref:Probable membrane transporter protein n=1 Tax=Alicyclobacillus dauci TaxID=1475485 RepID=A0ABY6Z137_9BACL|nr:sulfite exporter TauE/SafE family protein [Alicyclobacillus dauci]WAH36445.1 sulfite exporter TauE/SafE family protein [Alicyclobacillus dauci]